MPEEVWSGREVSLNHLKVFVVFHMFTLNLMIIANWMLRLESVSSLVMGMSSLATVFGMIKIKNLLEAGMWYK